MATFESTQVFPVPLEDLFRFFRDPANLVRVSPPELHMQLVEAPEQLDVGSRIVLRGSRWGIPQRVVSEVTALTPLESFTDEQREGPFGKWVHSHRFERVPEGTRVHDVIDYEPPGGLLGLFIPGRMIENDLRWIFAFRQRKLAELLGSVAGHEPRTT